MRQLRGKIDENDLIFISKKYGTPLFALPAPTKRAKINPQVSRFFYKDKIADVFHIKPIYYLHIDNSWRSLSEITDGFGNHWANLKPDFASKIHPQFLRWWMKRMELIDGNIAVPYWMPGLKSSLILNVTDTFFPDPSPESTSTDGIARAEPGCVSFATLRAASGVTGRSNITSENVALIQNNACASGSFDFMTRGFFLFDTSSIPDGDTVSSATLSLKGDAVTDNFTQSVNIFGSVTTASNTTIAAGDFQSNVNNTTAVSTAIALSAFIVGAYNDFALNSTGLTEISKTGISKFVIKISADYNNSAPAGQASPVFSSPQVAMADTAGTASDPKLVVTHSAAAAARNFNLNLLGVGQ